jgi:small subunit ribosomal protein S2
MKPSIFGSRNDIHIMDLQKKVTLFPIAYDFIVRTVEQGYSIFFVGTKKQAYDTVIEEIKRCNMFPISKPLEKASPVSKNWMT